MSENTVNKALRLIGFDTKKRHLRSWLSGDGMQCPDGVWSMAAGCSGTQDESPGAQHRASGLHS